MQRRQLSANKVIKNLIGEMTYTGLFVVVIALTLAVNKNLGADKEGADWDAKVWLTVTLLYYILDFIMQMS
jgi:hypothetical protein